jgi:hypothetical protein
MDPKNKPLHFNPGAAILLDEATFTIHVHRRTNAQRLTTNSPETNFLAVIRFFAAQVVAICDQALGEVAAGHPGFVPPGAPNSGGGTPGGTTGGNDGGNAAS